jgi:predicted nucleotide-binding protein (sugar kinase/HSP70/actin superfamily)
MSTTQENTQEQSDVLVCPVCGFPNSLMNNFCGICGKKLTTINNPFMSNNEEEVLKYLSSNFSENQIKSLLNIYHEFIGEKKSLTTLSQDEIDKFFTQL